MDTGKERDRDITHEQVTSELERVSGWTRDTPEGFTEDFIASQLPAGSKYFHTYMDAIEVTYRRWKVKVSADVTAGYMPFADAWARLAILLFEEGMLHR